MIACDGIELDRGDQFTLRVEHLVVEAGLVAVMGPNGAGKTTLLEVLAGRLPVSGTVQAKRTWFVPAEPPRRALIEVRDVLRGHGASDPEAWLDRIGYDGPTQLAHGSSGERMLVALAGALSRTNHDLLLDEPFGHLDPPHAARLTPLLAEHATERAVVFATHDPLHAALADRVLLMDGSIQADGSPEDVIQPEPLERCYGHPMQVLWTELGPIVTAEPTGDQP